ncbi:MAG: hypothetical protein EA374_06960 [Acholeplasmatales bacterium]|nr:MAG: hypothetical protein EA374_06960 [Acholeplasmatales bacterium]
MFESIPILGPIIEMLQGLIPIDDFITMAYDFIIDLSFAEKAIGGAVLAVVLFLGIWDLIKKLSKLIIVAAILFGLWLLYANGVFG